MSKRSATLIGPVLAILLGLGAVLSGCTGVVSSASESVAPVATQPAEVATSAATTEAATTETVTTAAEETTATPSTAGQTTSALTSSAGTATDTTYASDTTSITLTTVSTGSGRSAVTYYVADVQLTAGATLQSAFAGGWENGDVDYTTSIAEENDAVLAINGDYCTARDTGVIIRNGELYLDNPARDGLAIYEDGTIKVYDETEISAEDLLADGVSNTFSFGPALVVSGVIPDGLDETEVEDIGEQHTILGNQPRTGVGMIDTNHFVFVVVDGRSTGYSVGVTLSELAQIFKDLGCTTAYNLDGGGSSAMYFMGELVNNPLGQGRERGISDILFVQ
jgi:exopolysaccharide biosynthesis protein